MANRKGFTLLELLVVVSIIAILAAIGTAAGLRVVSRAREQATEMRITLICRALATRYDDFNRRATDELHSERFLAISAESGRSCGQRAIAEILARKAAMRTWFPQTWAEASGMLALAGKTAPATINPANESAEVLAFVLMSAPILTGVPDEIEAMGTSDLADTDGNGYPEFIDSWGKPLQFRRWPTRLARPGGTGHPINVTSSVLAMVPQILDTDYDFDDPTPWMYDATQTPPVLCAAALAWVETDVPSAVPPHLAYHDGHTWNPMIVFSAGPDGDTGIPAASASPRCEVSDQTAIADNICGTARQGVSRDAH